MVYIFLADGFEIIEAFAPFDMLTRAKIPVKTVGITGMEVKSSCGVKVISDCSADDVHLTDAEMILLPGGMPGTLNLEKSETVQSFLTYAYNNGLYIAAICAAPSILGHRGFLNEKSATCFPGFEDSMPKSSFKNSGVIIDGKIITARGAGVSIQFGLRCVEVLRGTDEAERIKKAIQFENKEDEI